MGKTGLGGINACFHIIVIIPQLFQDVKNTGYRMLGYRSSGIIYHIHHRDPAFPAVFQIHIIVTRGKLTNQLQMGCAFQSTGIHRRLIYHNNIRVFYPIRSLLIPCSHMKGNIPIFPQRLHRNIFTYTASVQNHDIQCMAHPLSLLSLKRSAKSGPSILPSEFQ